MSPGTGRVVCIGGATVDRKYRALAPVRPGTSNPVASGRSFGGVARNVAENLARLGVATSLVSLLGDDENGRAVLADLAGAGVDTQHVAVSGEHATAEYVAVLQPEGDLALGLADMAILDGLTPALLHGIRPALSDAWIFADCNPPAETLRDLIGFARSDGPMLALDAVSAPKAMRLPRDLTGVGLLFLNLDEARAFLDRPDAAPDQAAEALLGCGAARVVLTLGAQGLIAMDRDGPVRIGAVPAQPADATGAGDALIAATLAAMLSGRPFAQAARLGAAAAALTVESAASVRADLSLALLESALSRRAHPHPERELS